MYDLCVYGHLTIDRIFDNFQEFRSLGAIGNFWEACVLTNSSLFVDLQLLSIGEAIILVDKNKSIRQGRGVLNLHTRKIESVGKSKWNHIMYINKLQDANFIKLLSDKSIISADITSGGMTDLELLKHVDYLFISDEELFVDIEKLVDLVKVCVIYHYPAGSIFYGKQEKFQTDVDFIPNLNVLGAGDFFAASFVARRLLGDKVSDKECIEFAHKNTTKLLLNKEKQT
jgi:hypothetical protein